MCESFKREGQEDTSLVEMWLVEHWVCAIGGQVVSLFYFYFMHATTPDSDCASIWSLYKKSFHLSEVIICLGGHSQLFFCLSHRTHSRVVSWFVWSKLSCCSDSRLVCFMSCMTDLFFFSVIVREAYGFLSVLKSDILVVGSCPVIVDSWDLKLSRGRWREPAVLPLGDF